MERASRLRGAGLLRENRLFRRLFLAASISSLGDWFNNIAVLSVILQFTGSPAAVGLTLAMRVLPYLLVGPLGGVWSDRIRRTAIMISSDLARAVLALGFLLVTDAPRIWWAYLLTGLLVVFSALYMPARSAYLTSIVEKQSLSRANGLLAGSNGLVMVVGFGLGGLVVAKFGPTAAFLLNSLSFLMSAWLLRPGALQEKKESVTPPDVGSFWREFRTGVRAIGENRPVALLFLLDIGWSIGGGAINVLISVMAYQVYDTGSSGMGMLYASLGSGTIAGSLIAGKWLHDQTGKMQTAAGVSFLLDAVSHILFANSVSPCLGNLALAGAGLAGAAGNAAIFSLIAMVTAHEVQGRVFSILHTAGSCVLALSMMAAGWLTVPFGPRLLGTVGGAVILLFSIVYLIFQCFGPRVKNARREFDAT
ncbi:MFS transporter [Effusibacillus pohliae]|uniref:MFS transporter n=1 Tax=Effusibacillus pohliae TaxID=232270 RepID=UPI0003706C03|nr:MFS transporter [Effusibacillus pohliae]